jgi:hypothetical protein
VGANPEHQGPGTSPPLVLLAVSCKNSWTGHLNRDSACRCESLEDGRIDVMSATALAVACASGRQVLCPSYFAPRLRNAPLQNGITKLTAAVFWKTTWYC